MQTAIPPYLDVFLSVVRDNWIAQIALVCVFVLIVADWVFGLCNAIQHKTFSSTVMREGLYHKVAELGLLLVGVVIDGALVGGFDFGYSAPVFTALCIYICGMEVGSLLEIFAAMNPSLEKHGVFEVLATVNPVGGTPEGKHSQKG